MDIENITRIEKLYQKEFLDIARRAEQTSDMFWDHRQNMLEVRAGGEGGAMPILGCRVSKENNTLRMVWFYFSFYQQKNGVKRRTNVHISKPKNKHQYSLAALYRKALPGEIEAVEFCEKKFAQLRKESEALRKAKHALYYYKKARYGDSLLDEEIDIPDVEFGGSDEGYESDENDS